MHRLKQDIKRSLLLLRHGVLHLHMFRFLTWLLRHFGTSNLWLMYYRDLTKPISPYIATVPIDIGLAREVDMDELAAVYHHDNPSRVAKRAKQFRERVKKGDYCFVARIDGAVVAYNWIRIKTAYGAHDVTMQLKDDETYQTDAYTARAWRGKGIHPALNYAMLQFSQHSGYRITYSMLRVENTRSWVTMPRVGWQLSGTIFYFRANRAPGTPIWLVAGSAYPMPIKSGRQKMGRDQSHADDILKDTTDAGLVETEVFAWVKRYFRFEHCEVVRNRTWSKTYRLSNDERVTYLKLVPRERASVLQAMGILADAFPNNIPHVVACDPQRGWLLTHDHGGAKIDYDGPKQHLLELIETYARMQCRVTASPHLMDRLPRCDVSTALADLLDFLRPGKPASTGRNCLGADYFLGRRDAKNYYEALTRYRALLTNHVAPARRLPRTLNHGGLRPPNAAMKGTGECSLYSWDHATAGPAGLSLHGLFRGCSKANLLLVDDDHATSKNSFHRQLLDRYINTLVDGGYADAHTLRQCLPATITIGVMQNLLRFATYPTVKSRERKVIGRKLKKRLRDLLDWCDHLASKNQQTALAFSEHYQQHENPRRARLILEAYLASHPNDAVALGSLANILTEQGKLSRAQDVYRQALESAPERAELHNALGSIFLREMELDQAIACFRRALELEPDFTAARDNVDRAFEYQCFWEKIRLLNNGRML